MKPITSFGINEVLPEMSDIPSLDDAVTRTSANGVKSSGIWGAIWGALTALPTGFISLYDWVVAQLGRKANAELIDFQIPYSIDYGDGLIIDYIVEWKNGVAYSVNGWWNRNVGEKLDEFTVELDSAIQQGAAIQRYHVDSGVFYAVEFFRETGSDKITVSAVRGNDIIDTKYCDIEKVNGAYSVVESIERRIIAPSSATASGKAADALATKNELGEKIDVRKGKAIGKFIVTDSQDDDEVSLSVNSDGELVVSMNGGAKQAIFDCAKNGYLAYDSDLADLLATFAPAYSTSTSYAVDAIVSYNGAIYQCTAATSGAWNPSKWAARKLQDFFTDANGLLTNRVNALIDAKVGDVNAVLESALDGTEVE